VGILVGRKESGEARQRVERNNRPVEAAGYRGSAPCGIGEESRSEAQIAGSEDAPAIVCLIGTLQAFVQVDSHATRVSLFGKKVIEPCPVEAPSIPGHRLQGMILGKNRRTPRNCRCIDGSRGMTLESSPHLQPIEETTRRARNNFTGTDRPVARLLEQRKRQFGRVHTQSQRRGATCRSHSRDDDIERVRDTQETCTAKNDPTTPAGETPPPLELCAITRVTEPTIGLTCSEELLFGQAGTSQPI
jgi:hypothetical protein